MGLVSTTDPHYHTIQSTTQHIHTCTHRQMVVRK